MMAGVPLIARCLFLASTCLVIVCRAAPITGDEALVQSGIEFLIRIFIPNYN